MRRRKYYWRQGASDRPALTQSRRHNGCPQFQSTFPAPYLLHPSQPNQHHHHRRRLRYVFAVCRHIAQRPQLYIVNLNVADEPLPVPCSTLCNRPRIHIYLARIAIDASSPSLAFVSHRTALIYHGRRSRCSRTSSASVSQLPTLVLIQPCAQPGYRQWFRNVQGWLYVSFFPVICLLVLMKSLLSRWYAQSLVRCTRVGLGLTFGLAGDDAPRAVFPYVNLIPGRISISPNSFLRRC